MPRHTFEKPTIIGSLEPDYLAGVREQFPDTSAVTEWLTIGVTKNNSELMHALNPVTEKILEAVTYQINRPHCIIYQVDTRDVPADTTKPAIGWHVDNLKVRSAVVADTLPTEFIVRAGERHTIGAVMRRRHIARHAMLQAPETDELPTQEDRLAKADLTVYQPEPGEIALLRPQIHRTPVNTTGEAVARTLIRAAVLFHQPFDLAQ